MTGYTARKALSLKKFPLISNKKSQCKNAKPKTLTLFVYLLLIEQNFLMKEFYLLRFKLLIQIF